jgi:hypothetical protein
MKKPITKPVGEKSLRERSATRRAANTKLRARKGDKELLAAAHDRVAVLTEELAEWRGIRAVNLGLETKYASQEFALAKIAETQGAILLKWEQYDAQHRLLMAVRDDLAKSIESALKMAEDYRTVEGRYRADAGLKRK